MMGTIGSGRAEDGRLNARTARAGDDRAQLAPARLAPARPPAVEPLESRLLMSTQQYAWQSVNIGGGGFVSGIEFSPKQANLAYARTDVGGAYRWNGSTWTALNDNLTNADSQQLGVISVAPDPANASKVYLATGQYTASWAQNASILASSDQGNTWTRTVLPFKLGGNEDGRNTGERLAVDPNLDNILFLGTNNNGLWKSTDSGASWSQVTSFSPASVTFVMFDRRTGSAGVSTKNIYVGVNDASGPNLYRSTDGGSTWYNISSPASGLIPNHAAIDFNKNNLYVTYANVLGPNGATSGAVWKYNIGAGTWGSAALPLPTGQGGFSGLSVDAQHGDTLMVSTLDRWYPHDEVYRSTDGGATWTSMSDSATFDTTAAPWAATQTPHWISDVAIDPFNSAHAMFNTGFGLWDSADVVTSTGATNASLTWKFSDTGIEETVPQDLIAPQSGPELVSAIDDFDGFRHASLTTSSARLSPHMGTNTSLDFAASAPATMARAGNGGSYGYYSFDGGSTWSAFPSNPTSTISGGGQITVSADGKTVLWAPVTNPATSACYRSTYNGSTWSAWAASTGLPNIAPSTFAPVSDRSSASKFYVYDQNAGVIYTSTNGGVSFTATKTGLPTGGNALNAATGVQGDLWLAAGGNGLYHVTNSGSAAAQDASVQEAYRLGFGKAAVGKTYPAIYLWGKVNNVVGFFRSDDTGATWTQISDAQHQYGYIRVITGDPNVYGRVFLGTGGRGIIYGDPSAQQPIADGTYNIGNAFSNLLLEDPNGNTANTTQMVQNTADGATDQQWVLSYQGNGYYKIANAASGLVLDDPGSSNTPGVKLQQYAWNGGNNQLWQIIASGSSFIIKNKATGLVLDDPGWNTNPNIGIDLYTQNGGGNQDWIFTLIGGAP